MSYFTQRLAAAIALALLSPLLAAVAAAIRIKDGPPIIFTQTRVGRNRTPFKIIKLRTMINDADELLKSDPSANRLTRTGRILRKTSIDELPQLCNVVKGDMAIVGPRAVLPEVALNTPPEYESRFTVLPGITGLAQIRGRNDLPWSKRLSADVEYVNNRNLKNDLKIVLATIRVLLLGSGFQVDRNTSQVDDLGLLRNTDD